MKYFDQEERKLIESAEKDRWKSVKDKSQAKKEAVSAAKNTLKQIKNKNINLRLSQRDLDKVRSRAARKGMPYQTLLSSLIHQYVNGDIKAEL